MSRLKTRIYFLIAAILLAALPACSAGSEKTSIKMAPMAGMPAEVASAPQTVQQAYQFAAANPDIMQHIPCYCGCGDIGHTSNYSCYVAGVDSQGVITYDNHALGCSICVDITLDSMRMVKQGKSPGEIKTVIDATYGKYGPSNIK